MIDCAISTSVRPCRSAWRFIMSSAVSASQCERAIMILWPCHHDPLRIRPGLIIFVAHHSPSAIRVYIAVRRRLQSPLGEVLRRSTPATWAMDEPVIIVGGDEPQGLTAVIRRYFAGWWWHCRQSWAAASWVIRWAS